MDKKRFDQYHKVQTRILHTVSDCGSQEVAFLTPNIMVGSPMFIFATLEISKMLELFVSILYCYLISNNIYKQIIIYHTNINFNYKISI